MKFSQPTLITLTAPTASGKSFLLDALTPSSPAVMKFVNDVLRDPKQPKIDPPLSRIVSTTTRAKRAGEVDGHDYHFISVEESKRMEEAGEFAELIEFRGTRYGVTHVEMQNKINGEKPPVVVLEPKGLAIYEKMCHENGWGIFKVFVSTPEKVRLARLSRRTAADVHRAHLNAIQDNQGLEFHDPMRWKIEALEATEKIIATHTDRVLSATGDERHWMQASNWDAIVSGEDKDKAIQTLKEGIEWRNKRLAQLTK